MEGSEWKKFLPFILDILLFLFQLGQSISQNQIFSTILFGTKGIISMFLTVGDATSHRGRFSLWKFAALLFNFPTGHLQLRLTLLQIFERCAVFPLVLKFWFKNRKNQNLRLMSLVKKNLHFDRSSIIQAWAYFPYFFFAPRDALARILKWVLFWVVG